MQILKMSDNEFIFRADQARHEMIILQSFRMAMQFVGLRFNSSDKISYRIYRWMSFFILSIMFEPSCQYFVVNRKDLIKATEMCVFVVAEGVTMAKVLFIIYNQKLIMRLLTDLQEMADKKINQKRTKFLYKFNSEAEMISRSFIGMLLIASFIFVGGPAISIIYRTYVTDMNGQKRSDFLPYKGIFPFDFESTPGYQFAYAINGLYNVYLATYFAACDLFLVNCGLNLIGATQDLQHYFHEIDIDREEEINPVIVEDCDTDRDIRRDMRDIPVSAPLISKISEGLQTHYKIIESIDTLASIEQGIIFSQFFGVVFSLSAIAFQVVSSEGAQQFFFICPTLVILAQLFLYCYYGQRVADELFMIDETSIRPRLWKLRENEIKSIKLSESIYQLHWYNFPLRFQRYFQLIILRSQSSNYFSGFGFVDCSLESFAEVLKFVGSVVALFQNLQK